MRFRLTHYPARPGRPAIDTTDTMAEAVAAARRDLGQPAAVAHTFLHNRGGLALLLFTDGPGVEGKPLATYYVRQVAEDEADAPSYGRW